MKAGMLILPVTPYIKIGMAVENCITMQYACYRIKMTMLAEAGKNHVMHVTESR